MSTSCVLTLALDDESQKRFEALRQQWFPPARNLIPAHLTLFHKLPDDPATAAVLGTVAASHQPFTLTMGPPRSIGGGVAYFFASPQTAALHANLRRAFQDDLTNQDKQGFRPHIVVQNKVTNQEAAKALATLQAEYAPWPIQATGMDLWRYLNGPWEHMQRIPFS